MLTDATCEMEMLSSLEPMSRGLMRDTRWGVTSIRSGNKKLPAVQRLALKTYFCSDMCSGREVSIVLYASGHDTTALDRRTHLSGSGDVSVHRSRTPVNNYLPDQCDYAAMLR
jgi:hypothetical protein